MSEFLQTGPILTNTFTSDKLLQSLLRRFIPTQHWPQVQANLERLGARAAGDLLKFAEDAEQNPPWHRPFSPWGERIDEIVTAPGWQSLNDASAEEGFVASGYERKYGEYSRLYQFASIYLFHPSSAFYTCPLAMTDGAARLIECHGDEDLKTRVLPRLISRGPAQFWTSGQWMTEKTGGSDIGNTETIARFTDGKWRLYGTKWFTSAIGTQMAMTLARIEDEQGKCVAGSRGLSLFYLEVHDEAGGLNGIEILRLKQKLGTKALPTAELRLNGTVAKMVAGPGEGVKTIATLFNVTRIYNACTTMGAWRRLLDLALDYGGKRVAFNKPLLQHPLHRRQLAEISVQFHACFHLAMYVTLLLGREEVPDNDPDPQATRALLRLMTPIAKLYCAKKNMIATSELIESFGGAGFIEDTGLPKWLRDNQVLTIWEGTTNVLSLDLLRAIKTEQALPQFIRTVRDRLKTLSTQATSATLPGTQNKASDMENTALHFQSTQQITEALERLEQYQELMPKLAADDVEYDARDLAFTLGNIMSALLLLEHAIALPAEKQVGIIAQQFCSNPLYVIKPESDLHLKSLQI